MDQLHIDKIVHRIDHFFGDEPPFCAGVLSQLDVEVLQRVFGDLGYQDYLDDQTNRQIIRVYLTNALILGHLPGKRIEAYSRHMETKEGRAALSLHILMNSVEEADRLPQQLEPEELQRLRPAADAPPHLQLIPS